MTPGPTSRPLLESVLADLATESERLDALVSGLDEAGWRTPTPAAGWDVATQIAHLAWTDEAALAAATDKAAWDALVLAAIADPEGSVDEAALAGGQVAPAALLARWRSARTDLATVLRERPDGEKIPWYGPPMSATSMATARFMETWAHGGSTSTRRSARSRSPLTGSGTSPISVSARAASPTRCTGSRRRPRSRGSS